MEPVKPRSDIQSLTDILKILKRRKWSLIIPAVFIFFTATMIALVLPPVYRSASTILIEEQEIPAEFVTATVTSYAEQRIHMIRQIVLSFSSLSELVNRYNLYPNLRESWTMDQILTKMRNDIQVEPVSAQVKDPRTGRSTAVTIAFTLSYEGKDPETVFQVANTLTSLFLLENQQVRERKTFETTHFLELEMNRVRKELADLNSEIAAFKEIHMHELPELFQANLEGKERTERDIGRLNDQIRTLKDRESFLQSQIAGLSLGFGNEDKKRLEELKIQLVYMRTRFSDEHPDVVKTRREIANLEKEIAQSRPGLQTESASLLNHADSENPAYITLSTQLASTGFEIESLNRQIVSHQQRAEEYRRRIELSPQAEKAYNNLLIERNNIQLKYNDLMGKYMESQMAHGLEKERKGERFTIMDPARFPERPFKPNRKVIILLGFMLAVAGGVGFAAIFEYSDNLIHDSRRLGLTMPYPVLVSIPIIETQADITKRRWKKITALIGLVILIIVGLYAFNSLIMDFENLWTKISMRLNLMV